jgi:hypothetical protein
MRLMIALAAAAVLPSAISLIAATRSAPLVAKATAVEGVLERRMDDDTFRARWRAVADMPPLVVEKTEPILLVSHETISPSTKAVAGSPVSPRLSRKVALHRPDVCERHGMRRVQYGKRWRCRR